MEIADSKSAKALALGAHVWLRVGVMLDRIVDDFFFIASAAERLCKSNAADAHRRGLLANALRITDRIIPALTASIELAQRIAHLEARDVETFIYNDPKHAASCVCFDQGVFLLISTGLYSQLTERELLFVVGHELGHVVYNHYRLPARAILSQKGTCDAENALKLMDRWTASLPRGFSCSTTG